MKEQIKAPQKTQLRYEEIANLSGAQIKTLVIRMLTEMVEFGCKIEEKVKAMKSGKKRKLYREPTVKERKLGSHQWFGAKGRNKHSTRRA